MRSAEPITLLLPKISSALIAGAVIAGVVNETETDTSRLTDKPVLSMYKVSMTDIDESARAAARAHLIARGIEIAVDGGVSLGVPYLLWVPGTTTICLDGDFSADDLQALAVWIKAG
jgi:hypothetical protein